MAESPKMPGFKNTTKPQGRKSKAANDKNERAVAKAFLEETSFARVEKALGFGQFRVIFHNGTNSAELTATPRGIFHAGGKVRVSIGAGDIVILDGVESLKEGRKIIVEITGKLTKPEAQKLFTDGRIHKSIYQADDDKEDELFEYDGNIDAI